RTKVAGRGNPPSPLVKAIETDRGIRIVRDCPRKPEEGLMDVRCVPVVHGFVVGNRPAGFAEPPVHDRVIAQDHIWVGGRVSRGSIFPEIFNAGSIYIIAGTDIPFATDGKSGCPVSGCSPEVG